MKTTKKGFTLIELIVVIAIIGVLAAILVPSMLGYVRKSKISSANSAMSSIQKGIESTLIDADTKGIKCGVTGWIKFDNDAFTAAPASASGNFVEGSSNVTVSAVLTDGVKNYFDKFKKATGYAYIKKTSCVAVVGSVDGNYIGSYPGGYVDAKMYKKAQTVSGVSVAKLGDGTVAADIEAVIPAVEAGEDEIPNATTTP